MDFFKAKAAELTTAVTAAHTAANERVQTSIQGKKLLDEGGPNTEKAILAKQALVDAAAKDAATIKKIEDLVASLEDSAKQLRAVLALDETVTNVAGIDKFYEQAGEADKRAKAYKQVLEELKSPMTGPEMPQAEQDAHVMLQVKLKTDEHAKKIQDGSEKGIANLKSAWASSSGAGSTGEGKGGYSGDASAPAAAEASAPEAASNNVKASV